MSVRLKPYQVRHSTMLVGLICLTIAGVVPHTQALSEVEYKLLFPSPEHRWLAVEAHFPNLPPAPLHVRMSSASPGRYARHEFAKNLIEVTFTGSDGAPVDVERRGPAHWTVLNHGGAVRVHYRLFGDRVDGTYLAVDSTHAHMNAPATFLWADGLERRPVRVTLTRPPGVTSWNVATQLYPTREPLVFTAPNLAYFLDSPIEFSAFDLRSFTISDPRDSTYRPTFRVVVHHTSASGLVPFADAVERVVREVVAIFGEFPRFETGTYTFIADYLASASGDAMEHRNSTVLTANAGLDRPGERTQLLGAVAHEFFHAWNIERIRPLSLEPFDFTAANVSGELWLGEGITSYYGALALHRSGLATLESTLGRFANTINISTLDPGRQLRSVVEMSQMAPFTDAATAVDLTNFNNTFISYYVWGEAIGLGLDLALRDHSNNRASLDDYMRALWEQFGRHGDRAPGVVDRPYTAADAEMVLAAVAGDDTFADGFFARYIDGREVVNYEALLQLAGIVSRPAVASRATLSDDAIGRSLRIVRGTRYGSPLHEAGMDRGDVIVLLDGALVTSRADISRHLQTKRPGDQIAVSFRRGDDMHDTVMTLTADRRIDLVTLESLGRPVSPEQRAFRESWLGSKIPGPRFEF